MVLPRFGGLHRCAIDRGGYGACYMAICFLVETNSANANNKFQSSPGYNLDADPPPAD